MRELMLCARDLAERVDIDVVLLTGDERCFSAVPIEGRARLDRRIDIAGWRAGKGRR